MSEKKKSYGHRIEKLSEMGDYRLVWWFDRYYDNSRLRHPQKRTRDTDQKGAETFAKKWNCAMP